MNWLSNEHLTSLYLAGLNQSTIDEMGVLHLFNPKGSNMPQWERKRHGAMVQEALPGKNDGAAPVNIAVVWSVSSEQSNEAGTRCYQN